MKFWKRKPSLMLIWVAALMALLPLLAVLQYRWLGQVSRAERERMQASLRTGASQFSQDFDREIARAFFSFQLDATTLEDKAWDKYAQCYDYWVETTPYPQLIRKIYLVDADKNGPFRLSHFNRAARRFDPSEWTPELLTLRARLEQERRNLPTEAKPFLSALLAPIDEDLWAIVIPVYKIRHLPERKELDFDLASRYTIVMLDSDYIKQTLIPVLAKRYFSRDGGLDYNLAVISRRDPTKIIYQSDPRWPDSPNAASDATAYLFDVRPEAFNDFLTAGFPRREGLLGGGDMGGSSSNKRFAISILRPGSSEKVVVGGAFLPGGRGLWQLRIQHRAGSLETAVAGVRRRNLLISFSILLLLTVSVSILVISTQRAQRLARQQMEFVAGVSHELRTPLAVICSAGENLADGLIEDRQQVRRYGAVIRSEGRRLTEMVEQVLEFAGVQSGRKTYELRPVVIGDVIANALSACEPLLRGGDFILAQEIQPDLPAVAADAAALSRSIQNLLSNAIKYSGERRWIGIRAQAGVGAHGPEIQITVADQGLGIAPEDLPHIFEPFYRGRGAIAAQIKGSGLGLSLVRHIMQAHGGNVTVEAAASGGTSFTLHLPIRSESPAPGAQSSDSGSQTIVHDWEG